VIQWATPISRKKFYQTKDVGTNKVEADTRTGTGFRLSTKWTRPFKSAGGVSSVDYWQLMVCASVVVMLYKPCSEVVWRVLATHSIHQFPLHFPSCGHVSSHFNWSLQRVTVLKLMVLLPSQAMRIQNVIQINNPTDSTYYTIKLMRVSSDIFTSV